jgi:hypothetical protein
MVADVDLGPTAGIMVANLPVWPDKFRCLSLRAAGTFSGAICEGPGGWAWGMMAQWFARILLDWSLLSSCWRRSLLRRFGLKASARTS